MAVMNSPWNQGIFRKSITKRQTQTKIMYVHWLTLDCGHVTRVTGDHPPKKTTGCYKCWHDANYSDYQYPKGTP